MNKGLKLIAFDNDGTLVDTEKPWTEYTIQMFTKYFGIPFSEKDYQRIVLHEGSSLTDHALKYCPDLTKPEVKNIIDFYRQKVLEVVSRNKNLLSGVDKTFTTLRKHFADLTLGIVTASPGEVFWASHAKSPDILNHFQHIIHGGQVRQTKPHPEGYIKMNHLSGTHPSQALYVEDTDRGAQAGYRAGNTGVAIPTEFTKHQNFTHHNATVLCNITDLPDYINDWQKQAA